MDIEEKWQKALSKTEIVRSRMQGLLTFSSTVLPYMFLAESSINTGDSVIRKGEVSVDKPSLILPSGMPQFEGFKLREELHIDENMLSNFLLVRGVRFPSLKYNNRTYSLDVIEERLKKAADRQFDKLQREEDITTGLIVGPEDCWQLSVLLYVCTQVIKSVDGDMKRLLDDLKRRGRHR